jgi:acetyl-CoA acetyltransferase
LSQFQIQVKNTGGSTLAAGTPVFATGYTTTTTVSKALQ